MLLLSFLQKQQTSLKPFKPSTDQLEISPCDINTLQNRVVMRIEHMITEDKSNRHFNKFSLQLLLEMYGDNKTECWSFSHHQGKQAPIYHNSYLFLWAESCRPLPANPPPPPASSFLIRFDTVKLMFKTSVLESLQGSIVRSFPSSKKLSLSKRGQVQNLPCENEFYSHENKKITFTSMVSHLASLWNTLTRLQSSLCFFTIGIF